MPTLRLCYVQMCCWIKVLLILTIYADFLCNLKSSLSSGTLWHRFYAILTIDGFVGGIQWNSPRLHHAIAAHGAEADSVSC